MAIIDLILRRQSVRKYLSNTVEKDKILKCVEAARLAPSACNSQPWKFIVVDNPELKNQVAKTTFSATLSMNKFALQSPVLVIVTMERSKLFAQLAGFIQNKKYSLIDIGIAIENFCLQATELGLGTCIIGWFNEKKIKKLLSIPRNSKVVVVISVGYSDNEKQRNKIRKEFDEVCSFNEY